MYSTLNFTEKNTFCDNLGYHWSIFGILELLLSFNIVLDRSLIMGWREVTPKALKGLLSVVTLVSVCLYVCLYVIKLQVTVFDPVS